MASTPAANNRPASASIGSVAVSITSVLIAITPWTRMLLHTEGVTSRLTSSGPPDHVGVRFVDAGSPGPDRVAEVPAQSRIRRLHDPHRRPDTHGDCLARPIDRIAGHPGPTAETERAGQLTGEHLALRPQPFGSHRVGGLGGRDARVEVDDAGPVGGAGLRVQDRTEVAAVGGGGGAAGGLDQIHGGNGTPRTGQQDGQIAHPFAVVYGADPVPPGEPPEA